MPCCGRAGEAGFGAAWGDAHPGYLGRGAGAGGSFVSLETGPAVSAAPLCRFVRAPRPPARRRGRTWGCGGTGTPPAPPFPRPGPQCSPVSAAARGLRCIPRRGRGEGDRMGKGGVTLPEVPLSGSAGRHGNLAPSLRLSVRPSRSQREKLWRNGSSSGTRGAAAAHPHGWRCHPKCPRAGYPRRCPRRCAPLPGAGTGVAPSRWQMSRPDLGDAAWGGLWEGCGGGHGDGTMGTGTRRRVTTKAK